MGVPKMRIPLDAPKSSILNHMFDRILQYKPFSYWGKPRCMEALIYIYMIVYVYHLQISSDFRKYVKV